jgi:hypothetical protein
MLLGFLLRFQLATYQPSSHQFGLTELQSSFLVVPDNTNECIWGCRANPSIPDHNN